MNEKRLLLLLLGEKKREPKRMSWKEFALSQSLTCTFYFFQKKKIMNNIYYKNNRIEIEKIIKIHRRNKYTE